MFTTQNSKNRENKRRILRSRVNQNHESYKKSVNKSPKLQKITFHFKPQHITGCIFKLQKKVLKRSKDDHIISHLPLTSTSDKNRNVQQSKNTEYVTVFTNKLSRNKLN